MRVFSATLLIPILALGCGSLPNNLNSGAEAVRIEKEAPKSEESESLGEVYCEAGATFVVVASNMRWCQNILRNQAYKLGATSIVVNIELLGVGCENCISMFATAYKQKSDTKEPQATEAETEALSNRYRASGDWED